MNLYLAQHGEALPKEIDPDRPLSEQGLRDAERLAECLGRSGIGVARVLHSGKTRARQTAELLVATMPPEESVEESAGLAPNDATDWLAGEVAKWERDTLVVGHLPFMDKFVARLLTGREEESVVAFVPGSLVCLERGEAGRWTIAWMLRPEVVV